MSQAQIVTELGQAYTAGTLSLRNKIINGNFDWWQRGTSLAAGGFLADRWNLQLGTGTTVSQSRVQPSTGQMLGGRYGFSCNITAAGDAANGAAVATQRIEGVDTLQGIITISFTAAVDTVGKKIGVNVTQNFGSGGSPSTAVQLTPVMVTPGTMLGGARYTAQFTLPSLVGKTLGTNGNDFLEIEFYFTGGTNFTNTAGTGVQTGYFYLGQVQVESGNIATPFEQRPVGLELLMCQRYAEVLTGGYSYGSGVVNSPGQGYVLMPYAKKRTAPTVAFSSTLAAFGFYSAPTGTVAPTSLGVGTAGTMSVYTLIGTANAVAGQACWLSDMGGSSVLVNAEL